MLPNGTKFCIDEALYSSRSKRNLLSFEDIRHNNYHNETINEDQEEDLFITYTKSSQKLTLENFPTFSSNTMITMIESHLVMHQKCSDPKFFVLWHD